MSKNIVVFSDGTGNSAATAQKTNVWRLYEALDLSRGDQIAMFDDGVGTSSFKPLRVLGLALGIGVKRNVIELYKFLCRNFAAGDRIYGFGFSRGAYTIRVLNGVIACEGLIDFKSETELDRAALAAYRDFRRRAFAASYLPWVTLGRAMRDKIVGWWNQVAGNRNFEDIRRDTRTKEREAIKVHFLGLWDTVSAYGLPIEELSLAFDKLVWPWLFRDTNLPENVRYARHALSVDDERESFFPITWDESNEPRRAAGQNLDDTRLVQVWFAGMHANVGGGYADDRLAYVPLCWMIGEAGRRGLRFKPLVAAGYEAVASDDGRMYDSRAGIGAFYRYKPRNVDRLLNSGRQVTGSPSIIPLIHASVIRRMVHGGDCYAPISLPERLDVLTSARCAIPFEHRTPHHAGAMSADDVGLQEAINMLADSAISKQHAARLDLVLDTVWWRRVVYFISLFLALALLAYPILPDFTEAACSEQLSCLDVLDSSEHATRGIVQEVIGFAGGFLPRFAQPWVDAVSERPFGAIFLIVALLVALSVSAMQSKRIHDRARAAWNIQARNGQASLVRHRLNGQRQAAANGAAFFGTFSLLAAIGSLFSTAPSRNLWYQRGSTILIAILLVSTLACFGLLIWRTLLSPNGVGDLDRSGPLLRFARLMRTSPATRNGYYFATETVLPVLFLALMAVAVGAVVNRSIFDLVNSTGAFCKTNRSAPLISVETSQTATRNFDTSDPCWASGLKLEANTRYQIRLSTSDFAFDWHDQTIHTDLTGFAADKFIHSLFTPAKRWWTQNWFQPIARIGELGNEEYALDPVYPEAPRTPMRAPEPSNPSAFAPIDSAVATSHTRKLYGPGEGGKLPAAKRRTELVAEIKPARAGELFLYVNDAVLPLPSWFRYYENNTGMARVSVERIGAPTRDGGARVAGADRNQVSVKPVVD